MSLTQDDVKKVAKLAKLKLSEAEVEKFQAQLASVLDYVQQLDQVDTEGVEPTAQTTGLINNLRADEAGESLPQARAIRESADTQDGSIKVKAVL